MPEDNILLSEMINTRICHDLAGPINAVNNGVEFLLDITDSQMKEQALELLKLSAKELMSKLQIFRIAYGRADINSECEVKEIKEIVNNFFSNGKIQIDWPEKSSELTDKISVVERQIMVNMILFISGLMIYGGKIKIRKESSGKILSITGQAEKLKKDDGIWLILSAENPPPALTTYNAPVYFLRALSVKYSIKLDTRIETNNLTLTARF